MKKYKLKNTGHDGVVTGILPGGKVVRLGDRDTSDTQENNTFLYEVCKYLREEGIENPVEEAFKWCSETETRFFSDELILERARDGWPIELGLVEEVPEEPKRVYMDRYEALKMVYEKGKKVAYGSEEWVREYSYIHGCGFLSCAYGPLNEALGVFYNQKLWYVVEDK